MRASPQESRLVLAAQTGDRAALDGLLQGVQGPLYRYISGLVGGRGIARDILQEVLFRLVRKLAWLHEPVLFRPWAYRIATRETFKSLKRERRWSEQIRDDEVLEAISAPATETWNAELAGLLPELIETLSPASRAAVLLHYLHELSLQEVADVLGIPVGTAKSRIAYGLDAARRALRQRGIAGTTSSEA